MSQSRLSLQTDLTNLLGSKEVYFQPPKSIKMRYPSIVYHLDRIDTRSADNKHYGLFDRYSIIYMTKDADDPFPTEFLTHFPMSSYDRSARNDNLYHHYITLYY